VISDYIGFLAIFVFATTGVLACASKTQNIVSLVMLGIITALGGGTIRDLILMVPVFWLSEFYYVWIALAGSLAAFLLFNLFRRYSKILYYLDGLGVALFAVEAIDKSFSLGTNAGVAVMMGIITGIGGGLIRDVLTDRPTLIITRDLYITPILTGCIVCVGMLSRGIDEIVSSFLAISLIFGFRSAAIYFDLSLPDWLHLKAVE
jgi:uncharacterized membrane protein YeiH